MAVLRLLQPYLDMIKYRSRAVSFLWGSIVGALIAGIEKGIQPLFPTIVGPLAMYLVGISAYVYNDIQDLEADRINAKDRPLPSGRVSKGQAMKLAIVAGASAFALSLFLNYWVVALVSFGIALGYVYSTPPLSLKDRFFVKSIVASLWAAVSSLGGSLAVLGYVTGKTLFSATLFLVYGMGFSPVADIGDIEGDRAAGKRTIPAVMGPIFTAKFSSAIMMSYVVATVFVYSSLGFGLLCPLLLGSFSLLTIRMIWSVAQRWNDKPFYGKMTKRLALLCLAINASPVIGAL